MQEKRRIGHIRCAARLPGVSALSAGSVHAQRRSGMPTINTPTQQGLICHHTRRYDKAKDKWEITVNCILPLSWATCTK
jgi:hypothetical protein